MNLKINWPCKKLTAGYVKLFSRPHTVEYGRMHSCAKRLQAALAEL